MGKSCKTGKIPQPEAKGKQAGFGKSRKIGKIPQPEAAGKQADWGKSRKIRRIPHPEAVKKQVHWGENVKLAIKPQLASGVAGTAGLFVYHVQLSVGMMDSVQGHLRQSVLNERVREFSTATRSN